MAKKFSPKLDSQPKSNELPSIEQGQLALSRRPESTGVSVDLVVRQKTLSGAIALCVQASGLDDKEVYLELEIDAGHWSRIMKGGAYFPLDKLNQLMDLCGNEVPLQWLAHSRGYGLVLLKSEAERRAEDAEARLAEALRMNELLKDLVSGKR